MTIAIVFAGGVGRRVHDSDIPKQFLSVGGRTILCHTLSHFQDHPRVDAIHVACLPGWEQVLRDEAATAGITKLRQVVPGGTTSQDSVYHALRAAAGEAAPDELVLIHDGVRPIITAGLIDRLIATATAHGNAVTCRPAAETLLVSEDGALVTQLLPRSRSYHAQAPQVFRLGEILQAHENLRLGDPSYTDVVDSATLMQRAGHRIHLVEGDHGNLKITYPSDVDFFRGWLAAQAGSRW